MLITLGTTAAMLDLSDTATREVTARAGIFGYRARLPDGSTIRLFDEDEIAALAVARSYRPPKLGRPRKHKESPR